MNMTSAKKSQQPVSKSYLYKRDNAKDQSIEEHIASVGFEDQIILRDGEDFKYKLFNSTKDAEDYVNTKKFPMFHAVMLDDYPRKLFLDLDMDVEQLNKFIDMDKVPKGTDLTPAYNLVSTNIIKKIGNAVCNILDEYYEIDSFEYPIHWTYCDRAEKYSRHLRMKVAFANKDQAKLFMKLLLDKLPPQLSQFVDDKPSLNLRLPNSYKIKGDKKYKMINDIEGRPFTDGLTNYTKDCILLKSQTVEKTENDDNIITTDIEKQVIKIIEEHEKTKDIFKIGAIKDDGIFQLIRTKECECSVHCGRVHDSNGAYITHYKGYVYLRCYADTEKRRIILGNIGNNNFDKYIPDYFVKQTPMVSDTKEVLNECDNIFLNVKALFDNQTAEDKKIKFTHFSEYKRLVEMSRQGGIKLVHFIKYLRSCVFFIDNGGSRTVMTKNKKKNKKGLNVYYHENVSFIGICEIFKIKCPILNPYYNVGKDKPSDKYYNGKHITLCEALKLVIQEPDAVKKYNRPEFIPYLHKENVVDDEDMFNLFGGFPLVKYMDKEGLTPFEQSEMYTHLLTHICRDNKITFNYLINWIAHLIQKPDERAGVNILLYGGQGTGKGVLASFIRSLVDKQHYMMYNNIKEFTNKFNGDQQGKLFIYLDEVGDNTKGGQEVHNMIKNKTTEEEIRIENKGQKGYLVNNYARYMSSSNFENNLRIEADDRRFLCLHVSDKHQADRVYYKPIGDGIKDLDTMAAAFKYFATKDISNFDVAVVPNTNLKNRQKEQALPIIQFAKDMFANEAREEGFQFEVDKVNVSEMEDDKAVFDTIKISGTLLYKIYVDHQKESGEKPKAKKYFYSDLKVLGLPDKAKAVAWRVDGKVRSVKGFKLTYSEVEKGIQMFTKNPDFKLCD